MGFPKLVRGAKIPVRVVINAEDVNEFGERTVILDKLFHCNYQDSASVKYSAEKQQVAATGTVFIDGDILESLGIATMEFGITKAGVLVMIGARIDEDGTISRPPDIEEGDSDLIVSGYVVIFGRRRDIVCGCKARNLDGSVNYTRLDVI
jgi:hypothetical protein